MALIDDLSETLTPLASLKSATSAICSACNMTR